MAAYGYSWVPDRAFTAFTHDLEEGAWKDVSITKYVKDRAPSALLLEAPRPVVWKVRAAWCIEDLAAALGMASTEEVAQLDAEWDAAERSLSAFIASKADAEDAATRAAAGRLSKALLAGSGTEQTGYSYDDEVNFGRHQLLITSKDALKGDVEKVGIGPHLKRIHKATEALAQGIGRGTGQKRPRPRSKRIRESLATCTSAFNAIHDEIAWLVEHTPAGKHRDLLEQLHAPFLALLERNPPRTMPVSTDDEDTATEAPEAAPPAEPT